MLPYWFDGIVPDLAAGIGVLVAAHGNSLRALVKHLDGVSDDDIAEINLPTGVPMLYELGDDFRPSRQADRRALPRRRRGGPGRGRGGGPPGRGCPPQAGEETDEPTDEAPVPTEVTAASLRD